MKKKMAHIEIDLTSPPELTIAQKEELRTLGLKPESEIDTTDIPTLDESFWKNAVQNPFYKHSDGEPVSDFESLKKMVSVYGRLEPDEPDARFYRVIKFDPGE